MSNRMDRIVLFSLQPNVQHKVKVHDFFFSNNDFYFRTIRALPEYEDGAAANTERGFSWLVAVKWAESIQDLKNCRTAAPSSSKARELYCKLRKEVKLMKLISPPSRSR